MANPRDIPYDIRTQARILGFTRGANVTADDVGTAIILDGFGSDMLPLDRGEALVFNRSTSQRVKFGPTLATSVVATSVGAAGATKATGSTVRLLIGIKGSLWVFCFAAGSSCPCYVFFR